MSSRVPFFEHPSRLSMLSHGNPSSVLKFRFPAASLFLLVGPSGLEPPTLRLSGARSSLLSYGPILFGHVQRSYKGRRSTSRAFRVQICYFFCVRTNFRLSRAFRVQICYVFCVRTDFWLSRACRVQSPAFTLVSDAYNAHTRDDVSHKSFRPLHRVRRAGFERSRFRVPRCASQPPDAVWWR